SYFARRIACSAARSSTDNFTVPPPVSDHQILHVMQPSAIVDLNQGTLAFKAIAGASFVGHRGRLDLPHGAIARTPPRKLEGRAPASWGAGSAGRTGRNDQHVYSTRDRIGCSRCSNHRTLSWWPWLPSRRLPN